MLLSPLLPTASKSCCVTVVFVMKLLVDRNRNFTFILASDSWLVVTGVRYIIFLSDDRCFSLS